MKSTQGNLPVNTRFSLILQRSDRQSIAKRRKNDGLFPPEKHGKTGGKALILRGESMDIAG